MVVSTLSMADEANVEEESLDADGNVERRGRVWVVSLIS